MNGFTPRAAGRGRKTRLALLGAMTAASLAASAAPASASTSCDLVAATTGSDTAAGTATAPFRSAQKLVSSLSSGQTGCLRAGSYAGGQTKFSTPGVTLTSYPGERAELVGRVWVAQEAPGVTITALDLNGRNGSNLPSPTINADDVTLTGNDITNDNTAICVSLGSLDTWGRADRTLIADNRIHNCGGLPASNYDHGIYVAAADDTVIRDNVIYDNADRGIQLYPDAQRTRVIGNIIDGNGSGVIISGAGNNASNGTVIEHNVITNSRIRDNVESYWEEAVGTNNVVRNNCIGGGAYDDGDGGILTGGRVGFNASNNLITVPHFANRAAGDFTLPATSPCAAILAGAATSAVTDPVTEPVTDPVVVSPEPTTSTPVVTSPSPTETATPTTSTKTTSTTASPTTTTPATSDAPVSTTTTTTTKAGRARKQRSSNRRAHRGHRDSRRGNH